MGSNSISLAATWGGVLPIAIPLRVAEIINDAPNSYGFRPGRSAQQAVAQAQAYVTDGYRKIEL
jgi:hypothetical protein